MTAENAAFSGQSSSRTAITYPKEQGDWEPPRVPNGYVADPNNAWHILPLWNECSLRHQSAYLNGNCGCVMIVMRCNNPAAKTCGKRVAADTCKTCKLRRRPDGMQMS